MHDGKTFFFSYTRVKSPAFEIINLVLHEGGKNKRFVTKTNGCHIIKLFYKSVFHSRDETSLLNKYS